MTVVHSPNREEGGRKERRDEEGGRESKRGWWGGGGGEGKGKTETVLSICASAALCTVLWEIPCKYVVKYFVSMKVL